MNKKVSTKKSIFAVGMMALVAVSGIAGVSLYSHSQISEMNDVIAELQAREPQVETKIEYKYENVSVPFETIRNVTVEKEVLIDNENLDVVMDFVHDELDEDIDVDYIVFEIDAKNLSENYLNEHIDDILDDEDFFDDGEILEDYRKSEISIKKIYDPKVENRDFDDKDLELVYEVKIRAKEDDEDKEYFSFEVMIPFKDGEMEDEDIEIDLI